MWYGIISVNAVPLGISENRGKVLVAENEMMD
jgi:hypothetical protein